MGNRDEMRCDGRAGGWMDGCIDGRMDGCMDRRTDRIKMGSSAEGAEYW